MNDHQKNLLIVAVCGFCTILEFLYYTSPGRYSGGLYVFGPTFAVFVAKMVANIVSTGDVSWIACVTPTQAILRLHHSLPFDEAFVDTKLMKDAKEENLAGRLFYPGSFQEALEYILSSAVSMGIIGQTAVSLVPVKPGVIEMARLVWNNRFLYDIYLNDEFVRRVTCFHKKPVAFEPPRNVMEILHKLE